MGILEEFGIEMRFCNQCSGVLSPGDDSVCQECEDWNEVLENMEDDCDV